MSRGGWHKRTAVDVAVRALAWVWTRVLTERLRVATMWWLNEKVVVRVVGVVPGPGGTVLARVRRGRLALPSARLDRGSQPAMAVGTSVRDTCGLEASAWRPIDVVRRRGSRLDAILVATGVRNDGRGDGRAAWVMPGAIRPPVPARWLGEVAR